MDSESSASMKLEYQNHVPFGFEMPSDNEVSTMVEQILNKDNLNPEDDWAKVVEDAICIMSNPDYVSLPNAAMNSSSSSCTTASNNSEVNGSYCNGMYSDQQSSHASLSHQNYGDFYQQQTPAAQYMDHNNSSSYIEQNYSDHYPQNYQHQNSGNFHGNFHGNDHYYHHQQDYSPNNGPVYYVAQKLPDNHADHHATTYPNYASLPGLNAVSVMNYHQQATRTQSGSSGGNSPSSQSPVSEEEYHEPAPRTLQRRPSKDVTVQKKPKGLKPRRRKKDPNEPTKPVSAYALFFRDTQATIKGTKPDASFGEVSKIVAAMWDALDADRKTNYKKRTEEAKKDYLQQLALYRASLITSPTEHLYINTAFPTRSPPMSNYNRGSIYSSGIGTTQHLVKTQVSPSTLSPSHLVQDVKSEGQIYARIIEPEIMSPNYLSWETTELDNGHTDIHFSWSTLAEGDVAI